MSLMNIPAMRDLPVLVVLLLLCVGADADSTTDNAPNEQSTKNWGSDNETTISVTTVYGNHTGVAVTTTTPLQIQDPHNDDYVTSQTYWISTGILIAVVAILSAATIYLLVVSFRRRGTDDPSTTTSKSEGPTIPNNYIRDPSMAPREIFNNDIDAQQEVRRNFQRNPETSASHLRDAGSQIFVDISTEGDYEPYDCETPMARRKDKISLADVASYHPNSESSKPPLSPKPKNNHKTHSKVHNTGAELQSTILQRTNSLADSDDGYDNDLTSMPPLHKPNPPMTNPPRKFENTTEVYDNENYYDDVEV